MIEKKQFREPLVDKNWILGVAQAGLELSGSWSALVLA